MWNRFELAFAEWNRLNGFTRGVRPGAAPFLAVAVDIVPFMTAVMSLGQRTHAFAWTVMVTVDVPAEPGPKVGPSRGLTDGPFSGLLQSRSLFSRHNYLVKDEGVK